MYPQTRETPVRVLIWKIPETDREREVHEEGSPAMLKPEAGKHENRQLTDANSRWEAGSQSG